MLSLDTQFRLIEGVPACPLGDHPDDVAAWQECHGQRHFDFGVDDLPLFQRRTTKRIPMRDLERRVKHYLLAAVQRGAWVPLRDRIERVLTLADAPRSERTIDAWVRRVKAWPELETRQVRRGRSFVVYVSRKGSQPLRAIPRSDSPRNSHQEREPQGCEKGNTGASPGASTNGSGLRRLRRFAFVAARSLEGIHEDVETDLWGEQCRVRFDLRHAFGFALRWLRAGRTVGDIMTAYRRALIAVHPAACDALGDSLGAWSPSSTVAHASRLLLAEVPRQTFAQQRAEWQRLVNGSPSAPRSATA